MVPSRWRASSSGCPNSKTTINTPLVIIDDKVEQTISEINLCSE